METNQKINASGGSPFKDNPQLDVVYKTSDNKYFYTENDAKNYASNLEDKKVKKLVRGEDKSEKVEETATEDVAEPNKKQTKTKK